MRHDFLCLGNAIVDLISTVPEDFISTHGFDRGSMMLVDEAEAARRLALIAGPKTAPGGSAANTAACLASLGNSVGFVGKVGDDALGKLFRSGMSELGVDFKVADDHGDVPTANCLAVVTPDGERTMSTHLGACVHLSPRDLDPADVAGAGMVFIEGYLLDSKSSAETVLKAYQVAEQADVPVALTLSDSRCVARHLELFRDLAKRRATALVVCNETEAETLAGTADVSKAMPILASMGRATKVVTLGARGSAIVDGGGTTTQHPAVQVDRIVDLVGAGDAFAAGFLHVARERGWARGEAAALGALCAAEVIQCEGARPSRLLATLLDSHAAA